MYEMTLAASSYVEKVIIVTLLGRGLQGIRTVSSVRQDEGRRAVIKTGGDTSKVYAFETLLREKSLPDADIIH